MSFLKPDSAIEYLKGVGPQRGALLRKQLNIQDVQGLLFYFPFRYIDKTQIHQIKDIEFDGQWVQLRVQAIRMGDRGQGRGKPLVAAVKDATGTLELVWFRSQKWVEDHFLAGKTYQIYGKVQKSAYGFSISHPEFEEYDPTQIKPNAARFEPVYSSGEALSAAGLDSKGIKRIVESAFASFDLQAVEENLPEYVRTKFKLLGRQESLRLIHFPTHQDQIRKAQERFRFEELLSFQLKIISAKIQRHLVGGGFKFQLLGELFDQFYQEKLPFQLTEAQKRVIREIHHDLKSGKQMNRLLQGDVGSGKTIVALMIMLIAAGNGFQACIMAPTEVLANQHFKSFKDLLDGLSIRICLLTSTVKGKDRREALEGLESGQIAFAIGTHALIEDKVKFNNLGLVVIDEQHRFGVAQRSKLWAKSKDLPPHILVMTATPIPRTLAMTIYGDLEVSVIDELPPNRKEIYTRQIKDIHRSELIRFMREEIAKGRQIYIVYPLIEESEKVDLENLQMGYEKLLTFFPLPQYRISVVHGKLKPADKDMEMRRFAEGRSHIMVATTVIEVGVNVPNASVMVIENAERFGLSQLHQLRGRVGRGAEQSYCILMTADRLGVESKARMDIMCQTNDGFKIAEEDLRLRGPGDLSGTRQSGLVELKVSDVVRDNHILIAARKLAEAVLERDPNLSHPANLLLRKLMTTEEDGLSWNKIS